MKSGFLARFRVDFMDHPRIARLIFNIYPPYLGAGIAVEEISSDWRNLRVAMKLRWYNRNYVNSHFGGNLFSMTDPFYMLMLIRNLGSGYMVWDMAAKIQFLQPGRGRVSAVFRLDAERLDAIRCKADSGEKLLEVFLVDVMDDQGQKVATVKKTLYIRKKTPKSATREGDCGLEKLLPPAGSSPAILSSGWGTIKVAGLGPGKDWKLWPGGGRNWDWSEHGTGHQCGIQPGDVQDLLLHGCKIIILTTGRLGRLKVADATLAFLQSQGMSIIVASTGKAIDLYNKHADRGDAVGGLFHATC